MLLCDINQMQKQKEDYVPPITYESYINNYQQRTALKTINFDTQAHPPERKNKSAQIKTIQKFIGRLKTDNKNHEAILSEMEGLNLSKYVQEISTLIANCVNEKQIRFYSEVATRMNQEYEDVPAMLLKDLHKQFANAYESPDDNKPKLKSLLLFITELFVCGFSFPYKDVNELLKKMVKAGTKKKNNFTTEKELRLYAYYYNCDSYSAFLLNFSTIFTHVTPKWLLAWREQGKPLAKYPDMIPAKIKEDITNIFFSNYISSCVGVLEAAFTKIKQLEAELRESLRMSGEFNKAVESNYNELKEKFLFTKQHLALIVDAVNSPVQVRSYESELVEVEDILKKYINKIDNVEIFENEFQRELYQNLPELCKTENKGASDEEYKEFKERLDRCKNKTDSDEIAQLFETINNKRTRRLLVKDVLEYRKEYQLVTPFMCRIAAIVALTFRDMVDWVTEALFAEYDKLRDNINTNFVVNDKRSRNLKYICEFTKFKVIDSERTINSIQNLIDDLKGYNIELLIAALENVGRFLYLSPNQATKFTFLLSKLDNVMKQKSFPLFTTSQLLNSVNLLKPHQERPKTLLPEPTKEERQAQLILDLDIIQDLDTMLPQLQKLVLTKEGLEAVQSTLVRHIENYDFLGTYHYAYMLGELDCEPVIAYIINSTTTRLQEAVNGSNYQNCLMWSRFLGELYKYELIKRAILIELLDKFLKTGGPDSLILNLICTVLETCEHYLDSKKVAIRNQVFLFLVDFKKFIFQCSYVPMLEEFKIIDVFDQLEPNLTTITSEVLASFLKDQQINLNQNTTDLSKTLDIYLEKRNLKNSKINEIPVAKDPRQSNQKHEPEEYSEEKNNQAVIAESKLFENQFLTVMSSNIKDYAGRIAKSAFVEKVIERKKEKRKVSEGKRKIVVIGRSANNKFTRKDVVYSSKDSPAENGNTK